MMQMNYVPQADVAARVEQSGCSSCTCSTRASTTAATSELRVHCAAAARGAQRGQQAAWRDG